METNFPFQIPQVLVNVIKYKLDHMRRKIETEDLVTTNRASFICPTCVKTFTDLEVDQLFDPMSGCLRCSYCGSEVEEEGSDRKKDSRSTLVKFNEQFRRLFDLLSKVILFSRLRYRQQGWIRTDGVRWDSLPARARRPDSHRESQPSPVNSCRV